MGWQDRTARHAESGCGYAADGGAHVEGGGSVLAGRAAGV